MPSKYRTNRNVVFSCKYRVVWCPKYRRSILVDGADEALKRIVERVCLARDAELIELEVVPDHVHLLVDVDPQYGIHRLIKEVKGTSSRELRAAFPFLKRRLGAFGSPRFRLPHGRRGPGRRAARTLAHLRVPDQGQRVDARHRCHTGQPLFPTQGPDNSNERLERRPAPTFEVLQRPDADASARRHGCLIEVLHQAQRPQPLTQGDFHFFGGLNCG